MDEEIWELLMKSFNRGYASSKKPSYLITLNDKEYELTYEKSYDRFPEGISIREKESDYLILIGQMNKDYFSSSSCVNVIDYEEDDNLNRIIDRMKYYNNKREEERRKVMKKSEEKFSNFLYGDK